MRILLALGGNALLRRGEPASADNQRRKVEVAAAAIAEIAAEHEVIVVHEAEVTFGHLLELALRNALPDRDVVGVITHVVVDPEKPGEPEPHAIAEIRSLRALVESGALVVCAGGGIPVAIDGLGNMHGVEAVVDKDLTAALLARRLDADLLLLLTDVDAVHANWGAQGERPLAHLTARELREMDFAADSMGPKVEAACRFAEATGHRAAIGALTNAARVARGEAGTQVLAPAARPAIAAAHRLPRI